MSVIKTLLTVVFLVAPLSAQTIEFEDGAFWVVGWEPDVPLSNGDLQAIFAVYTGGPSAPPVMGNYFVDGNTVVFRPRFPLAAGVDYRAVFRAADGSPIEAVFSGPALSRVSTTRVDHVYPSSDVLPSNQLKLYVRFSAAMARGQAWDRIHLVDENGQLIESPFVEVVQELWDPDQRMLTVLFDPGRIKRGVGANVELGPVISEGKQYTLVIDSEYLDARGAPLEEEFQKSFLGGPSDRTPIDPDEWRLVEPRAKSFEPLVVDFPEPLDFALLQWSLRVEGVAGSVSVDREESRWHFTPDATWQLGEYSLLVDLVLEDLAGNRIDRPFDIDTLDGPPERTSTRMVRLPFRVRP